MLLTELFPKHPKAVAAIKQHLNITTIEDLRKFLALEDESTKRFLTIPGIGKMFLQKVMRYEFKKPIPTPMDSLVAYNLKWITENFQLESAERLRETFEFTLKMRDKTLPKP